MQPRGIVLQALLCLVVLCCAACTRRNSGPQPQAAPAGNQATRLNGDLHATRILNLRGVLNDHEGNHLTGVVGVLFAIYEQQEGGTPLWQETRNVEVNKKGRFKAMVGSTKSEGIPPELFRTEKTLWLGSLVLLPGEVEQSRIRLVSTSEGLMAEQTITPVTPEESVDQPPAAEVEEASSSPTASQQSGPQQSGSQQDPSGPANGRLRARRGFRHAIR